MFAVVDLETTGFAARGNDRIVEVSIEVFDSRGQTFDSLTSLVQPGRSVGASWIHGITENDVADAPCFEALADRIHGLLRGTVVVGHNVAFDISFLRAALERAAMVLPVDAFVADTMRLAPCFYPQLGAEYDRRLPTCCEVMGIESRAQHRAGGDAAATRAVLGRCLKLGEERGWRTLADFGIEPLAKVWRPGAAARRLQGSAPRWNERVEVARPTFSPNVTKRVDILVVANPDSQSAKLLKARATGVQVVAEQVFWRRLGGIDAARARLS